MKPVAVIVHSELSPDALPDELDVLAQSAAVAEALANLGYETFTVPFGLDIRALGARLNRLKPRIVFNLVEALDGDGRLIHLACSLLDHMDFPYTGAGAEATFLTSHKVLTKQWLKGCGIPTPVWLAQGKGPEEKLPFPDTYIVKTLWEDASIGIDAGSVGEMPDLSALEAFLDGKARSLGKPCFAERFIDGREFNLSVLGGANGPEVLPAAEISFSFPDDRPRIVDYKAKWDEDSVEYQCTQRSFDFRARDKALLKKLAEMSLRCWKAFDLRGYVRVDFRVDGAGRPWVLEINTNPCIAPDSGFVAACGRAGLSFPEVVRRIISDTLDR